MKTRLIFYLAFAVMLAVSGCEEEDEPSPIPTVPTTFSIEDGAEITDTIITLSAGGSTVEDEELDVSYIYYIGKSADVMEKTSAKVTLEPYTQYFWCAQAKTDVGEGEKTDVRTFYCVPNLLELTSDNGDGEWAAIIRWNNADKFKSVTITATPDHEGYSLESQTVKDGVDSCYFKTTEPKNDAYTHWWDDANGIYYEPVIYTFNVEAKAQVGDKTFTFTSSIKEILLDNEFEVRDHEFNVYRVVQIGKQTWLADDLRMKTDLNGSPIEHVISTLGSGATGVLYQLLSEELEKISKSLPKGYHISTNEDWIELEAYYGLLEKSSSLPDHGNSEMQPAYVMIQDTSIIGDFEFFASWYMGVEQSVGRKLASGYDWKQTDYTNGPETRNPFNAKPFGTVEWYDYRDNSDKSQIILGAHTGAAYLTYPIDVIRVIWAYSTGININTRPSYRCFFSVRLVKD